MTILALIGFGVGFEPRPPPAAFLLVSFDLVAAAVMMEDVD